MVNSICIKSNNVHILNYLLDNFLELNIDNVYISERTFKLYKNIILHNTASNYECEFYSSISEILSNSILKFYENQIVKNIIKQNYFYFNDVEKNKIYNLCLEYLYSSDDIVVITRKDLIFSSFLKYLNEYKKLILDGFVNFRLSEYVEILQDVVDLCVNKFVVDREYFEFIELLKIYINSKTCTTDIVHLIYSNEESILLDEYNNPINLNSEIFNAKYLSDITFSSNDYALNTLLTLLPNKIYIHLIDKEDEFINTLKLIFTTHIFICKECNICNVYKLSKSNHKV